MRLRILALGALLTLAVAPAPRADNALKNKVKPDVDVVPAVPREFRGVWVATVDNIDWPSKRGLPVEKL